MTLNLVTQLKKRLHFDGTFTFSQQTTLLQIVDRACHQRPLFLRCIVVGPDGSGKTYLAKTWVQLVDRWGRNGNESMIEAFRYLDCNAIGGSAKPYRALAGDMIKQLQGYCDTDGFTPDRMYAELASALKSIKQLVLFIDFPDHGASIDEATKFVEDLTSLGKEYNNMILIPMVREGSAALTELDTPDTDAIIPLSGPTLSDIKRKTYLLCESYERSIEEPTAQFVAAFLVRTRQNLSFVRKLIEKAATLTPPGEYFPELTPEIIQTALNQLAVNPALQPIIDEYPLNLVLHSYAALWNQEHHLDGTPCPVSVSRLYQMFVRLTTDHGSTSLPSHVFEGALDTLVQRNLMTRPNPLTISLHPTLCYADTKTAILAWDPFSHLSRSQKKVRGVYATKTETILHIKKPNQIAALKALVTLTAQNKTLEPLTSKQIYSRYLDFCAELGGKPIPSKNFTDVVLPTLKHHRLITTEVVTTDKGWETWVSDTGLTAEEVQAVHDRYQAILAERKKTYLTLPDKRTLILPEASSAIAQAKQTAALFGSATPPPGSSNLTDQTKPTCENTACNRLVVIPPTEEQQQTQTARKVVTREIAKREVEAQANTGETTDQSDQLLRSG